MTSAGEFESKIGEEICGALATRSFRHANTKLHEEGARLLGEASRALALEACLRCGEHARRDKAATVTCAHVERALPQLVADWP